MTIHFAPDAEDDFAAVIGYLAERNPTAGAELGQRIFATIDKRHVLGAAHLPSGARSVRAVIGGVATRNRMGNGPQRELGRKCLIARGSVGGNLI